jgi:uncharacterized membrane protein
LAAWKEAPPTTSEEAASLVARALKVGREALAVSCFVAVVLAAWLLHYVLLDGYLFILLPLHTKIKTKIKYIHCGCVSRKYFFCTVIFFSSDGFIYGEIKIL